LASAADVNQSHYFTSQPGEPIDLAELEWREMVLAGLTFEIAAALAGPPSKVLTPAIKPVASPNAATAE